MREYRLEIASPARKDIRRLDKQTLKKLNKALEKLCLNPLQSNTKKLVGLTGYQSSTP